MEAGSRLVGSRGLKGLDVAMKSGEEEQEGQEAERILEVKILPNLSPLPNLPPL